MKKSMVFCAGLCVALAFTSCKSSESAYKKAYEKAKAQEQAQQTENTENNAAPVVTPLVETPSNETTVVDNSDNVAVQKEKLSVVDGAGLKNFSVVVGAFRVKASAENRQQELKNAGYAAQIAYNSERNLYRVVASTFDSKADAVQSRNQLRSKYPDAWLLFNQQ